MTISPLRNATAKRTLGELCRFVKGTSATLKTEPGPYPLVVTAEYRRSSDTYQFDEPAVCIPLVSSTGHGDAAIHRIHYQEGKFALANLMVALLPNTLECNPQYLYYLLTSKKDSLLVPLMQGTANVSLKIEDLARVSIELPSLEEQRRIVEQLSTFSERHPTILRLSQESEAQLQALCRSMLFSETNSESIRMSDLVSLRQTDTKVERHNSYAFAGVYCFGKGVFKGQTKNGTEFAYDRLTQIRSGEFTYPKLMAWEGALGIVPVECDGLFVSPEYPVFTIDAERVLPEVLDVYYRTPSVWPIIAGASKGTNVRRRRLHPSAFLSLRMPVPPMTTQLKIRKVRKAVQDITAIRKSSEAEVKSLMTSVLNQVFSGERSA